MKRSIGAVVLGLSACGYPLTQFAVRHGGRRGAALAELACAGLAIRDASMVASGVADRLEKVPAALLRLETAVGVVACLAGLRPVLTARQDGRTASPRAGAADNLRPALVAALFALHTVRFAVYLSPGQGRRTPSAAAGQSAAGALNRGKIALPGMVFSRIIAALGPGDQLP